MPLTSRSQPPQREVVAPDEQEGEGEEARPHPDQSPLGLAPLEIEIGRAVHPNTSRDLDAEQPFGHAECGEGQAPVEHGLLAYGGREGRLHRHSIAEIERRQAQEAADPRDGRARDEIREAEREREDGQQDEHRSPGRHPDGRRGRHGHRGGIGFQRGPEQTLRRVLGPGRSREDSRAPRTVPILPGTDPERFLRRLEGPRRGGRRGGDFLREVQGVERIRVFPEVGVLIVKFPADRAARLERSLQLGFRIGLDDDGRLSGIRPRATDPCPEVEQAESVEPQGDQFGRLLRDTEALGLQPRLEEQVAIEPRVLRGRQGTAAQVSEEPIQARQARVLQLQQGRRVMEGAPGLCGGHVPPRHRCRAWERRISRVSESSGGRP